MLSTKLPYSAGYDAIGCSKRLQRYLWWISKRVRERIRKPVPRLHVLVAGTQRSGTNMVMHALQWSSFTHVIHETDPSTFVDYEMRPLEQVQAVAGRSKAPYFVLKSLCELDQIGELMDGLAPAKTLWIVRDFDGSVRSMVRSFRNFTVQLERLTRDKNGGAWRGRGMSDATQALLGELYHPEMSEASAAALMWYYRNILFFERGLDRDPRVCVVLYENLASQPVTEFAHIFQFLGLRGWSPWITHEIHAHSVKQRPCDDISPEVRALCAELHERFMAVARSQGCAQ